MGLADVVRACTRCPLHEHHHGPVPFDSRKATFLFLGAAPTPAESSTGKIWTGKPGYYMRRLVRTMGIPPTDCAWGHVVSCQIAKRHDTPSMQDILACSTIRNLQVAAVDPKVVVLCGVRATMTYRPDMGPEHVGWTFMQDGRTFIIAPHPYNAVKWDDVDVLMKSVLAEARRRGRLPVPWVADDKWPDVCVRCGQPMELYDPDGVPFCVHHAGQADTPPVRGEQMRMM